MLSIQILDRSMLHSKDCYRPHLIWSRFEHKLVQIFEHRIYMLNFLFIFCLIWFDFSESDSYWMILTFDISKNQISLISNFIFIENNIPFLITWPHWTWCYHPKSSFILKRSNLHNDNGLHFSICFPPFGYCRLWFNEF